MADCSARQSYLCDDNECDTCLKRSVESHKLGNLWSTNNKQTARQVFKNSKDKFTFNCSVCNHDSESTVANLSSWVNCKYCRGVQVCGVESCEHCFKLSMAAHKWAIHWSPRNEFPAIKVARARKSNNWFKCSVDECCQHILRDAKELDMLDNLHCGNCGRYACETKLLMYLRKLPHPFFKNPDTEWCKSPIGSRLPYDFLIPQLKTIIELDGPQHFHQVQCWSSAITTVISDVYKAACAVQNGYHVIRITVHDVWNDQNNWQNNIVNTVKAIEGGAVPTVHYFSSKADIYDRHKRLMQQSHEDIVKTMTTCYRMRNSGKTKV